MFKRLRSPRFAVVITLALIAVAAGSLITASAAGAAPRLAFVESVKEFFGVQTQPINSGPTTPAAPFAPITTVFSDNFGSTTSNTWTTSGAIGDERVECTKTSEGLGWAESHSRAAQAH